MADSAPDLLAAYGWDDGWASAYGELVTSSELEGVLRILSFLGLGVALIGIGRLYGPVLRAERAG